ncbi:hypothetical protein NEOC65_000776 [Neochlamydia sp. AcF65]|nr:hypothetical protein [Neochlamydia sp. AcF65]
MERFFLKRYILLGSAEDFFYLVCFVSLEGFKLTPLPNAFRLKSHSSFSINIF